MSVQRVNTNLQYQLQRLIKSLCDRFIALVGLLVFAPIMFIVALAIYYRMGKPVIFAQPRPGLNERVFTFYKFRTMLNNSALSEEERITRLGQFLRNTSLDELPQLWNVLKGDMSFVGPRPLIVEYLERYSPEQARRHEVKPGITGYAQVKGRNAISWEEKFLLDVWYIDHWSLWLDLRILLDTVLKVLQREGINQEGHATSEEFKGDS